MVTKNVISRHDHLSFKGNLKNTRYGWLRLTPAHSVHLIGELLDAHTEAHPTVLDPFCGTGTTALVCAEKGVECVTTDINPFLLWLGQTKTRHYNEQDIEELKIASVHVIKQMQNSTGSLQWLPPLHQIEKWWNEQTLSILAQAFHTITELAAIVPVGTSDLLKIAFCRTMIEQSNASFNHQSMSFKQQALTLTFPEMEQDTVIASWQHAVSQIALAAHEPVYNTPRFLHCDARHLTAHLTENYYSCIITSPPYPNRMSYIRELRPYMYGLGHLNTGKEAGELDWQAIGGTWGCATSNLSRWEPNPDLEIPFASFGTMLAGIAEQSPLLARYVHKYFQDMVVHCKELFHVVKPHGTIAYIVGNSKFYDVLLPVDAMFASLFASVGFEDVRIEVIRKRSSKKELFEYVVTARKP